MIIDYSIETENDIYFLYRNGHPLLCPKQHDESQCGSWCPHFTITIAPNSANVRLLCVPTVQTIVLEGSPDGQTL